MNDFDYAKLYLHEYFENGNVNYLEKAIKKINRIFNDMIHQTTIYKFLQYISAVDTIKNSEHLNYLNTLYISLESKNTQLIYTQLFNLLKLTYNNEDLHITDILIEPIFPLRTRIINFIKHNWKYIIPPSLILPWILNKI